MLNEGKAILRKSGIYEKTFTSGHPGKGWFQAKDLVIDQVFLLESLTKKTIYLPLPLPPGLDPPPPEDGCDPPPPPPDGR